MPRKRNEGPAVPRAPRTRKKKTDIEKKLDMPVYEPVMQTTGLMMEDGMYTQDYGYAYGNQGGAQYSNDSQSSPFMTPACSTPQPIMMRQSMPPPNVAPSPASLPPQQGPSGGPLGPSPTPLEFRIHDMNRRLYTFNNSGINEHDHKQWFEAFAHEFFDDDATIYLMFPGDQENPPEKCVIHRSLIARFFLTFVEAKAKEVYFVLRGITREHQGASGLIHFENDNVLFVQRMESPFPLQIEAECKLTIEFTPYDEILNHRVREWRMEVRGHREMCYSQMTKDLQQVEPPHCFSRSGFCHHSFRFMHMAKILEPMQVLMAHSKAHHVTEPKELLRRTLFHFQASKQNFNEFGRMATPMLPQTPVEEAKPKPVRKRQRKPAANAKNKKTNASPAPSNPSFPNSQMPGSFTTMGYQDVMVVGEPSMMGGDYGEEDERTISRVENSQYDPNALQMQQNAMNSLPPGMMPPGGLPPNVHMAHPNGIPPHAGLPAGLPHPHPQMGGMGPPPPQNGMPPPYGYGQPQGTWPSQPNTTMITG